MLDVYDLVYEEVRRNGSSSKRHELTLIHEVVSYLPDLREAFFFWSICSLIPTGSASPVL